LILTHTEAMAVAVSSVAVYPNGFEFSVHAVLNREQKYLLHDAYRD